MFREGEGMCGTSRHPSVFLTRAPLGQVPPNCALRPESFGALKTPDPSSLSAVTGLREPTLLPGLSRAAWGPGQRLHTPGAAVKQPAKPSQARGRKDRKGDLCSSLK